MGKKENARKAKKLYNKGWWFIGLVVVIIGSICSGCDNKIKEQPQEGVSSAVQEKQVTIDIVNYKVIEKNDISTGNAKRYGWEVVVEEPVTVEQLKELAKKIVEEAKTDKKFNALVIGFYDYVEFIGYGYTLGKVEYAPNGDWGKANTVSAGEYDKMDYKFDLREKDWTKQLTKEEAKIFKAWHELYVSKATNIILPDESEITMEIAKQFNIEEDEVYQIMIKDSIWMFDNNQ